MSGSEIDVDALVAELRREAADIRASLGATALPPEDDRATALREVAASSGGEGVAGFARLLDGSRLAGLSALADPGDVDFQSHRVRVGQGIVAAKRVLRRLLTPVLDRQAAFNRAAVQAF